MYINKVIDFRKSWEKLTTEENIEIYNELTQILSTIDLPEINRNSNATSYTNSFLENLKRRIEKDFNKYNWKNYDVIVNDIKLLIGNYKNNVSCKFISNFEDLNKVIFSYSLIAYKNSLIDIPIIIILDKEIQEQYTNGLRYSGFNYENILKEFKDLQPIVHSAPFLILNLSNKKTKEIEIFELIAERNTKNDNFVINKCIEFPPHLKQAGLGILTYFGTIIEQKYPDHNSKVSIEQEGNLVRLIIETETGNIEIIEKILEEYSLVVRDQKKPEDFLEDKFQIMQLRHELDIAQLRTKNSELLLSYHKDEMDTLKNILMNMSKKDQTIIISNVNNNHLELNNSFNLNMTDIISNFKNFVSESGKCPEIQMKILDLNESLEELENKKDPEKIKNSTTLKKLENFLNEANEKGTKIEEFITKVENGYGKVKNIGKKYNSIAKWCGAPIIPFFD